MKISILLPYKENFSPIYPGAVSLFVKDTANLMIRFMKLHRRVAPKITFEKSFATYRLATRHLHRIL